MTVIKLIKSIGATSNYNEIVELFTTFLKGANPHSLTSDSLLDLEKVISDHLDNMNYWDNDGIKEPTDIVPSIYSL